MRFRRTPKAKARKVPSQGGGSARPERTDAVTDACSGKPHKKAVPDLAQAVGDARLTPKQVRFALALAHASSIAHAARLAGYAEPPEELARDADVRAIAAARVEEIKGGLAITYEAVIAELWRLGTKRKGDEKAKVQALAQILKYLGGPVRVSSAALEESDSDDKPASVEHVDVMRMAAAMGVPLEHDTAEAVTH